MSFYTLTVAVSSAIANAATITFNYPTGIDAGHFRGSRGNRLFVRDTMGWFDVVPTFGASTVTVANPGATIPAGGIVTLQANVPGSNAVTGLDLTSPAVGPVSVYGNLTRVSFGAVDAASATAVCAAQAISGTNVAATINGASATGGVATFDVARSLVMVSTNAGDTAQVVTVTGTDMYGRTLREARTLNGTTVVAFQKAFRTVTAVSVSATMTGNLTVGNGNVLGLPMFIPDAACILMHIQDGATATAGTIVAGATATATASTGDVRGTWTPNGTPNGTIQFALNIMAPDVNDRGNAQFAG